MCGTSGCGSSSETVRRINLSTVQALNEAAQKHQGPRMSARDARISLLSTGATPALEILSTDKKDMRSLLVFQKLGMFGALDLKIEEFKIEPPKAYVKLWFQYAPFGDGIFAVEGHVIIRCEDISMPLGCDVEVDIDLGKTKKEVVPLLDWNCLKNCAPQCIYCGADWQCWLACAGGCIIQCL